MVLTDSFLQSLVESNYHFIDVMYLAAVTGEVMMMLYTAPVLFSLILCFLSVPMLTSWAVQTESSTDGLRFKIIVSPSVLFSPLPRKYTGNLLEIASQLSDTFISSGYCQVHVQQHNLGVSFKILLHVGHSLMWMF